MCTVSWVEDDEGLHVYCNRDEQRSRVPALPPAVSERGGTKLVHPTDGQAGGTWIAANEHGLAVTLLNHYAADAARGTVRTATTSRGELVLSLMDCEDIDAVRARLTHGFVAGYRPCALLALQRGRPAERFVWDGRTLETSVLRDGRPQSSSSFRTNEVLASRARVWAERAREAGGATRQTLEEYHRSHDPDRGPFSVCMHRPDARSQSLTRLRLGPESVRIAYEDAPPCARAPAAEAELPLARLSRA